MNQSTDVSIIKYLGCSIIYFSTQKSSVVSTCLELVELEEANADGIVKAVISFYSVTKKNGMKIS
jgi:predicted secreted Zn-dependent protease